MKWITRSHVHADRVACPWLISRFVDSEAEFIFVPASQVIAMSQILGATPFDAGGKALPLDHHDNMCTFEAILARYNLSTPALKLMAEIVHGDDIVNADKKHPVSDGLKALAVGYSMLFPEDLTHLKEQSMLYDALYARCRLQAQSAR